MPITSYAGIVRFTGGCGADLPRWIKLRLEELQFDKAGLLDFGLSVVTRLCETLLKSGVPGLHFYTINQSEAVTRLCNNLSLAVSL
jgi:methylenetetrahydrofolate reductase (NADPH)